MNVTPQALWYIESHLSDDLSLESIAEALGVSRFHLSRAFAVSTGCSLAAYLRARRLSIAARALTQGAPDILTLALDTGYGSHEAFTRAFRQQFGSTPEQLRAQAGAANIQLQEPIRMDQLTSAQVQTPRFVSKGEIRVFGLSQHCERAGDPAIPSLWSRFVPHIGTIAGQIGNAAYGVIYGSEDCGNYHYLCGVEVRSFPAHPAEFSRFTIPPQTYAVFDHAGHVSLIVDTWSKIWEHGLENTGHQAAEGPAFELYGEKFDGRTGLGGFEIWVPVVAK